MPEPALPAAFITALESLIEWLNAEQVPYTIIGGVAISLIAQPRATQDVDAAVWLDEKQWKSFLHAGETRGFQSRLSDALEFAARARVLLLRHQKSGVSVDLSLCGLPFEREMIKRAATLEIGGLKLKVLTPEDLIITKAVAQRPKDIADIEAIVNIHQNLDFAYIRHWVKEFSDALETPELMENLERILRHG